MTKVASLSGAPFFEIARTGLLTALMMAAHSVQKDALAQLTDSGRYKGLSVAYADYVVRLAVRDYSPGDLASELDVSKQLCSKVIRELETRRLIDRRPNPKDSRSSLLSLSPGGKQLVRDGARAADATLKRLEVSIGAESLEQLTQVLDKLCQTLSLPVPVMDGSLESRRLNYILIALADHARSALGAAIWQKGFDRIGGSGGQVFELISRDASQIRTIVEIMGVSKQMVALAAAELDRLGYITRQADPADGRQLFLRLSPRGRELAQASAQALAAIEESFRVCLTAGEFQLLSDNMAIWHDRVAQMYDPARVLRSRITQVSTQLLTELGPAGAQMLAQQLMTLTRGKL